MDHDNNVSILNPVSLQCQPQLCKRCKPFFGIFFAILSALALVLDNLCGKLCIILPPCEIVVIGFSVLLAVTLPSIIYSNTKIIYSKYVTGFLILRGILGTFGMLTRMYAVQNMPLGDATVLMFSSPIFVAIFARIFLRERLHFIYFILTAFCLVGIILIARPTFVFGHPDSVPEYDNILVPSFAALSSAIFAAISIIVIRNLVQTYFVKADVILVYYGMVGLILSTIASYIERGFQFPFCQSMDYLYAALTGIALYLNQYFVNTALLYSEAFIVTLARTSGIFFGFIFQIFIYSLVPSSLSFGGATLIAACNGAIFIFKWYQLKQLRKSTRLYLQRTDRSLSIR